MKQRVVLLLLLLLLCAGCGATRAQEADRKQRVETALEQARSHLREGDADAALLVTDRLLGEDGDLREARLLAAEANLALADRGRGGITRSLLEDAARHYKLALDQDDQDPASWLNLARVHYRLGDFENGRDTALEAALRSKAAGDPDGQAQALIVAADNEMQIFVAARAPELQTPDQKVQEETQEKAEAVLARLKAAALVLPGEAFLRSARVYQWLALSKPEIDELERGIAQAPDHFPLHTRYLELRQQRGEQAECANFYRDVARDVGARPGILFGKGMADNAVGDKHAEAGNRDAAVNAYRKAVEAFEQCKQSRAEWAAFCDQWLAIEHLALARCHHLTGESSLAKDALKAAYAATPDVLATGDDGTPKIRTTSGATYAGTLFEVGRSIASAGTEDALRAALAFWEEFVALHPGKLGWLCNNAAFNARDLGVAVEKGAVGQPADVQKQAAAEAKKLYERSYELYCQAVELSPDEARTINDCGLMLVYHLHRDYDKAIALFERAIAVGQPKVDALPADAGAEQRNDAEEAVGDAYQNKAKALRDVGKPFAEYQPLLEQAVRYYPYQRREAARLLAAGGKAAAPGAADVPDPRAARFGPIADAAAQKAEAKDFDAALLILDGVAKDMQGFAPFHFYQGLYALRYAEAAAAAGGSAGQIDSLFADARNHLQRAIELDGEPIEPRLRLAQANWASGEAVNAAKIAADLLLHIASRGGTTDELLAETQRVRALAGSQVYRAARQADGDEPAELQAARDAFRNLEQAVRLDAALRRSWFELELWAGARDAALAVFERALQRAPADQALHGELVETCQRTQLSAKAAEFLGKQSGAVPLWYRGMAQYHAAFQPPANASADAAIAVLELAIGSFDAAAQQNPGYRGDCDTWIATCTATQGFFALDGKQFDRAEQHFLAAAQRAPSRVNAAISGERTTKQGLEWVVYQRSQVDKDLPAAIATLQKACAAIPGDAGLWNNLGLFARDHGTALERGGDADAAKRMYETSYDAYRKAVQLEPTSVRQRNDLAVVAIYNLKRDLEESKKLLLQCIADGERELADAPPDGEAALRDLQEAVGDSYQNLGYYLMTYEKDQAAAARKHLEKSLEFHPGKARASVRLLERLGQ